MQEANAKTQELEIPCKRVQKTGTIKNSERRKHLITHTLRRIIAIGAQDCEGARGKRRGAPTEPANFFETMRLGGAYVLLI
jgi:hypothetical protein